MKPFKRASFYFVAHADDWQLFMDPEVGRDIADKACKVVIVHTTAGDAGLGESYWKARESAAIESLLFRNSVDQHLYCREDSCTDAGKKEYFRSEVNNCSCYFLRLPDGAFDGNGFPSYGSQSMSKLRTGIISSIDSVDRGSVYTGWEELVDTIDHLIENELHSIQFTDSTDVLLNFPDDDPQLNPFDHNDHFNTSLLVKGTRSYTKFRKRAFLSYHIIHSDKMLTGEDLFWKIGMFSTYHQSLFRQYGHSTLLEDPSFIPWCFRDCHWRAL